MFYDEFLSLDDPSTLFIMTSETDGAACSGNQVRFSWCCWVVLWLFAFPLCAAATLSTDEFRVFTAVICSSAASATVSAMNGFTCFIFFLGQVNNLERKWHDSLIRWWMTSLLTVPGSYCEALSLSWAKRFESAFEWQQPNSQQCVANLNVIVSFPTPEINFMSDKETHEHSFFIHFRLPFHLTSPAIAFLHPLSSHSWTKSSLRQVKSTIFTHISLPDTAPQSRVWVKREIKSIFLNISKPISSYSQIKLSNRARSRIFVQRFGVKSNTPFKAAVRTCIETPNRSYLLLAVSECGSWHDDCHPSSAHSASLKSSNRSETSPNITYRS